MTGKMINAGGIPLMTPNTVSLEANSFYVSYNDRDVSIYGDVTTALVLNNPLRFSILNGNHTKQYNEIVANGGGYEECLDYFKNNIQFISKFSDKLDEITITNENGSISVIKCTN